MRPVPSLANRKRRPSPTQLLVGVPRISPERELAVVRALIKPQARHVLEQQIDSGEQQWLPGDAERVRAVSRAAAACFGLSAGFAMPHAGEYLTLAAFDRSQLDAGLATALLLSHALPSRWVTVGRLFVRDERFFRRERGVALWLRPANDVHLTKPMRASYREAVRSLDPD